MGTRSTTTFIENGKAFCSVYRQFDGYPSGMGQELADFLKKFTVKNGFQMGDEEGEVANGLGCLAAQLIKHFKDCVGNIYIEKPVEVDKIPRDSWIEFFYTITTDKEYNLIMECWCHGKSTKKIETKNGWSCIFRGNPSDFNGEKIEENL